MAEKSSWFLIEDVLGKVLGCRSSVLWEVSLMGLRTIRRFFATQNYHELLVAQKGGMEESAGVLSLQ